MIKVQQHQRTLCSQISEMTGLIAYARKSFANDEVIPRIVGSWHIYRKVAVVEKICCKFWCFDPMGEIL